MLTEKGHQGHYGLKGPYGDTCNSLDNIKDPHGSSFPGTEMPLRMKEALVRRDRERRAKGEDTGFDEDDERSEHPEEEDKLDMVEVPSIPVQEHKVI